MDVVICGAESEDVSRLSQLLTHYMDFVCAKASILTFRSAEELMRHTGDIGLALMDADMDGVARLRGRFPELPLILWSASTDSAIRSFALHPAAFLVKPFSESEFYRAMVRSPLAWIPALSSVSSSGKRSERVRAVDIRYIESYCHNCVIHRSDGEVTVCQSLSQLAEQLGGTFARCHKSYLVNLYFIRDILPNQVVLTDDRSIPLGARWAEELSQRLEAYRRRYGVFAENGGM